MYTSYLRPWLRALHLPWSEEGGAGRQQPWSAAAHRRWLANAGPAAATSAVSELVPHLLTCFLTLERRVGQKRTISSNLLTCSHRRRVAPLEWRRHISVDVELPPQPPLQAGPASSLLAGWTSLHARSLAALQARDTASLTEPLLTVTLSYQVSQARQEVESRSDATLLSVAGKALVTYRAADTILQATCLGPRRTFW